MDDEVLVYDRIYVVWYFRDSGFGHKREHESSYRSSSSAKREYDGGAQSPPRKSELDGLTPFEKNFYVESPSVAAMSESDVEEYRRRREITVEGKDVPKPVKSFHDVGFPGIDICFSGLMQLTVWYHFRVLNVISFC